MDNLIPILEHDPTTEAIIEPRQLLKPLAGMPERAVICFFQDVIDHFVADGQLTRLKNLRSEMGVHPVYAFCYAGQTVALFQPGVGVPFAAAMLEEVIALGCRTFIACGGAGALDRDLALGHILYSGDNLDGEVWDSREWHKHWTVREKLVALATEACLLI